MSYEAVVSVTQGVQGNRFLASQWGLDELHDLAKVQQHYMNLCYSMPKANPPALANGMPSRMKDSLRFVALKHRQEEKGLPSLPGILFPKECWKGGWSDIVLSGTHGAKIPLLGGGEWAPEAGRSIYVVLDA